MKLLSFNCRGLESTQKKLALKRMLMVHKPYVILLQETLGSEHEVSLHLSTISSSFSFLAQSARGLSSGLAIGWNQSTVKILNSRGASFGMGIQAHWAEAALSLNIINIYGPYSNRIDFWETIQTTPLVRIENTVIGGDFNFTLGSHEI